MTKKLTRTVFILMLLPLFFISCSSANKVHNVVVTDTVQTYIPTTGIVVSLLEQVRLAYLDALKYQDENNQTEAIKSYEKAVDLLNNLSFYTDIDSVSDYVELEKSVLEDYQKYVDNIDELPVDVSLSALREWLDRKIPDFKSLKNTQVIPMGEIPLEINEYVEKFIDFFTGRGKHHMRSWIARSGKYFPMMRNIFKEEGVPEGLIFLSAIESGLNPKAVSRAKAVGLWQFMRATGANYGLEGNFYYDDRRNPEKATRAAARHLKDLNASLGNWYLALAAYNCGEARVKKAMARENSNNYWVIYDKLPKETRGYVPQFIAASVIMINPDRYGFNDVEKEKPLEYEYYTVYDCFDMGVIASAANTTSEILDELNPELLQFTTPPSKSTGYTIKIPKGSKDNLAANYSKIPPAARKTFVFHKVKKGETIANIADKYGVTTGMIADANNISRKTKLKRNSTLRVPIPYNDKNLVFTTTPDDNDKSDDNDTSNTDNQDLTNNEPIGNNAEVAENNSDAISSNNTKAEENNNKKNSGYYNTSGKKSLKYKVKKGDSISEIAELFETRITDLRMWNDIPYNKKISVGEVLTIFVPKENYEKYASLDFNTNTEKVSTKSSNFTVNQKKTLYYSVRKGESLNSIAQKFNVSLAELKDWNNLKSTKLRKGTRIKIYSSSENLASVSNKKSKSQTSADNNANSDNETTYKVRKGDSLFDIAKKLNVSIDELKEWNNLTSNDLNPNQKLTVKEPHSKVAKGDNYVSKKTAYHTVRKGETLDKIATKFKLSVADLKKINKLKNNNIKPGKKLVVTKN